MIQAQVNKYLESAVQTASPAQLLIMLYDGAIRFSRAAIEAIQKQKHEEAHNNLLRAQDIISEFVITLDRSAPMAEELLQLYEYFIHRLREANTKKQPEPIQEVLGHLVELKETWVQAAKLSSGNQPVARIGNA